MDEHNRMEKILQAVAVFRCLPPEKNLRIAKLNNETAVSAKLPVNQPIKNDAEIINRLLSIIFKAYCIISIELVS
ncbi:hypothetical protein PGRAT_21670 [Paenibacillus graminis]|uniref:Uncharacterized protein n=1 Tax=Paenibacillus graminis TaxID=189425 RepID=A0A089M9N7_9BACL|nr:hypothetical protein PGRAT_21670 [Paenibacillus graminis]